MCCRNVSDQSGFQVRLIKLVLYGVKTAVYRGRIAEFLQHIRIRGPAREGYSRIKKILIGQKRHHRLPEYKTLQRAVGSHAISIGCYCRNSRVTKRTEIRGLTKGVRAHSRVIRALTLLRPKIRFFLRISYPDTDINRANTASSLLDEFETKPKYQIWYTSSSKQRQRFLQNLFLPNDRRAGTCP